MIDPLWAGHTKLGKNIQKNSKFGRKKSDWVCRVYSPQDDSNVSHEVLPLNLIRIHIFPEMDYHQVDQEVRDEIQLPLIS